MYKEHTKVLLIAIVLFSGLAVAVTLHSYELLSSSQSQNIGSTSTGTKTLTETIKFKILHGNITDYSREVNGTYYVFINMNSFGEDFAPWLVYMALTRDYEWWTKEFSEDTAKAAYSVKKMFQEHSIPPLRPEDIPRYRRDIAATVYEWWFADLWEKIIGSCIPSFYVEVIIGDKIYAVFYTNSDKCIEQYSKVLRLGGRFDLIVVWASSELKSEQGDFKTVPGWSSIYTLDSGFTSKLLKVIELSSLWNKTWISISILSAGHNVGNQPIHSNVSDYQHYNTSIDVTVKDLVNELIEKYPDAVKIRLPPSETDAIVFVKLTKLNEVLGFLESRGVKFGVPENAVIIFE